MNEQPTSVQLPRVNVSTIIGVTIPTLLFIGSLLGGFYNYIVSKTKIELNQQALEVRLIAFEAVTEKQTVAIQAVEKRLDHMDDTIANLKVQVTPKH